MSKIAIITDSTAYIPDELLKKYQINVVPQVLIWGEQTYEDGVNIMPDEFYSRLRTAKIMPSTSQVTPASFQKIFNQLVNEDAQILCILISEKLSGTIASAIQAKEMFPGATIEIVDSYSTAMAMGFQVLSVSKAVKDGANLSECVELAKKARNHAGVVFAVDTLEFLHRGGRIGGGTRFLGTALSIKPILELREGAVEGIEKVRTRAKSLDRLVEIVEERIAGRQPVRLATLHANASSEARDLLNIAEKRIGAIESIFTEVSPVVGTHAGPGTIGLAYMAGM
jgi:DegV family protein with EDD domain